ncbi:hypothetical protein P167DRAFT_548623 [Morchella conica CCBAS932]|uniref:Uncharacterized protein n=1 Tax=Morchella conica CCBAS932 TaxID=1392247 RepID=A0A3N4KED7_9PEZI|nr:hypothetical protein P167DRAFT_548623 [Morchella conica CCBAS932]
MDNPATPPQEVPVAEEVRGNEEKQDSKEGQDTEQEKNTKEEQNINEELEIGEERNTEEDKEVEDDPQATRDSIDATDDGPQPCPSPLGVEAFLRSHAKERELQNLKYLEVRPIARRLSQSSEKSDDTHGGVRIFGSQEPDRLSTPCIRFTKQGAVLYTQAGSSHFHGHGRGVGWEAPTRERILAIPKKIFTNKDEREDRMRAHEELKLSISRPTELPRPILHPWHRSTPDVIYERLCFHFQDHCVDVVGGNVIIHKTYKRSISCTSTPVHWLWLAKPTGVFLRLLDGKGKQTGVNDPGFSVPVMMCKICRGRVDLDYDPCVAGYGITLAHPGWNVNVPPTCTLPPPGSGSVIYM